jgi:hypothetical protein
LIRSWQSIQVIEQRFFKIKRVWSNRRNGFVGDAEARGGDRLGDCSGILIGEGYVGDASIRVVKAEVFERHSKTL